MVEHVIKVAERSLPRALTESVEYQQLSSAAQRAFLEHVRYVQEFPHKLAEWLSSGDLASELESLVERIDLDVMINLGVPADIKDGVSPWVLQVSWVTHGRPLTTFLKESHIAALNEPVPPIGASLEEIESWIRSMNTMLSALLEDFFSCMTYDHAVSHLIALHTCLAGLRFGIGRIRLQYPR